MISCNRYKKAIVYRGDWFWWVEGSVDDVPLLLGFRQTNQNMPPAQLDWLQTLFAVVLSDMQVFYTLFGRNIGMGVRLYWTMCCATKLHRRQSHRLLTHFFATPWLVLCRRQTTSRREQREQMVGSRASCYFTKKIRPSSLT